MIQRIVNVLTEGRFLLAGLASISLVLALLFASTIWSIHDLEKRVERKERKLSEILRMGRDLEEIRSRVSAIEASAIGGGERELLLPALSRLAEKAGMKEGVKTIDTRTRKVLPTLREREIRIRLEGLSWEEVRSFLRVLGDYRGIFHLKGLKLTRDYQDQRLFDASITIIVFEKG